MSHSEDARILREAYEGRQMPPEVTEAYRWAVRQAGERPVPPDTFAVESDEDGKPDPLERILAVFGVMVIVGFLMAITVEVVTRPSDGEDFASQGVVGIVAVVLMMGPLTLLIGGFVLAGIWRLLRFAVTGR